MMQIFQSLSLKLLILNQVKMMNMMN